MENIDPQPKPSIHEILTKIAQKRQECLLQASCPKVNPAEPLEAKDNDFIKRSTSELRPGKRRHNDVESGGPDSSATNVDVSPSYTDKPAKKIIKKSQKCLSNLTQEMSITLRQSIACLDDIFMKARQCLSEMEENDRKYQYAKVHKLELKKSDKVTTLMPARSGSRSIVADSENEINNRFEDVLDSQPRVEKILQTDISIADNIINESLARLETVCKDMLEFETFSDAESGDESKKNKTKRPTSKKRPLTAEEKARTKKKLRPMNPPNAKELELTRQKKRKEVHREASTPPTKQPVVLRKPISKTSDKQSTSSLKHEDSLYFNKHESEKPRPVTAKSETRTKKTSRTSCKCCHSCSCKCGIEVKSFGTDPAQHAKLQWIKKSTEDQKCNPEFMDILDDIKLSDVERFQSEYPRKDHIIPLQRKCVQDTLLYKLVFDKSLNIWDFLLKNRFTGLNRRREYALKSNSSRSLGKKKRLSSLTLERSMKEIPMRTSISKRSKDEKSESDSSVEFRADSMTQLKFLIHNPKSKFPKTLMPKSASERRANQTEMLMPKKHHYTILPIQVEYDRDREDFSYKKYVRDKLRPYIFDPESEHCDIYTVLPVSVCYDNVKETLLPYVAYQDAKYEQNYSVMPMHVYNQYYNENEAKTTFWDERHHCHMSDKLCKKCEESLMLNSKQMSPKEKGIWQAKYKRSPAENIIKFVGRLEGKTVRYANPPYSINTAVTFPNPPKVTMQQRPMSYRPVGSPPQSKPVTKVEATKKNNCPNFMKKPFTLNRNEQYEAKDIEQVVSSIETKLVHILQNPIQNKVEAFQSVENDITNILAAIQKNNDIPIVPNKKLQMTSNDPSVGDQKTNTNRIGSSSTPSLVAQISSRQKDGFDGVGLSKTTLDEVESQIMESFEEDIGYPKENAEDETEKPCLQVDDPLENIKKTVKIMESLIRPETPKTDSYSRTDTIDFEEKYGYTNQDSLFIIKEESSPGSTSSNIRNTTKIDKIVSNSPDKVKMHIIDEESGRQTKTSSLNEDPKPKEVDDAWQKFREELASMKKEEIKLKELAENLKDLNEPFERLDDIPEPEELKNANLSLDEITKGEKVTVIKAQQTPKSKSPERGTKSVKDAKQNTKPQKTVKKIIKPPIDYSTRKIKKLKTEVGCKKETISKLPVARKEEVTNLRQRDITVIVNSVEKTSPDFIIGASGPRKGQHEGTQMSSNNVSINKKPEMKSMDTQISNKNVHCMMVKSAETQISTDTLPKTTILPGQPGNPQIEITRSINNSSSQPEITEVINFVMVDDNVSKVKSTGNQNTSTTENTKKTVETSSAKGDQQPEKFNAKTEILEDFKKKIAVTPTTLKTEAMRKPRPKSINKKLDEIPEVGPMVVKQQTDLKEKDVELVLDEIMKNIEAISFPEKNAEVQTIDGDYENSKAPSEYSVNSESYLTPFMQAIHKRKYEAFSESDNDILTFLDNLKKISCDYIAIHKNLAKSYSIANVIEKPSILNFVEIIGRVRFTTYIPPFLKEIQVVTFENRVRIPREHQDTFKVTIKKSLHTQQNVSEQKPEEIENVFEEKDDSEASVEAKVLENNTKSVTESLGEGDASLPLPCSKENEKLSSESDFTMESSLGSMNVQDHSTQTDLCFSHLPDGCLKWPPIRPPTLLSKGCLITTLVEGLPKVIYNLNEQAGSRELTDTEAQTIQSYSSSKTLIVKVNSLEKLEELIDASIRLNHPLVKATPAILPLMYGVLFSVMYLGLNFTFTCG